MTMREMASSVMGEQQMEQEEVQHHRRRPSTIAPRDKHTQSATLMSNY